VGIVDLVPLGDAWCGRGSGEADGDVDGGGSKTLPKRVNAFFRGSCVCLLRS